MKSLLLKSFYDLKNFIKDSILTFIIVIFIFTITFNIIDANLNFGFLIAYVFYISFIIFFFNQEELDKKNNFDKYIKICPIKNNKVILSKYIIFSILSFTVLLFSALISSIQYIQNASVYALLFPLIFLFIISIMFFSINILLGIFFYNLNFTIKFLLSFILTLFINIICILLLFNIYSFIVKSAFSYTLLTNLLVCIIFIFIFYKLTCFKYSK